MEEGFILDQGGDEFRAADWVKSGRVRSLWTGLKVKAKDRRAIVSFRCGKCGLLQDFAR